MGVCVERVINSGPFDKSESLHLKSFNQTLEMNKLLIVAVLLVVCIGSDVVFGAAVRQQRVDAELARACDVPGEVLGGRAPDGPPAPAERGMTRGGVLGRRPGRWSVHRHRRSATPGRR